MKNDSLPGGALLPLIRATGVPQVTKLAESGEFWLTVTYALVLSDLTCVPHLYGMTDCIPRAPEPDDMVLYPLDM